jgi:hypothetical protein
MNYKKQILLLFAISIFWILFDIFILCQPTDPNWTCQKNPSGWTQISFLFCFVFFIFSIPLYFFKEAVYLAWRKFALWYLPIVAVLILSAGGGSNGFNPGYGMDTESLTFFFSGLFAFISLVLIIYKSIKLRGK